MINNKTHIKMEALLDFKTKSLEELESYINDEGFIWACENGYLEVAQWLLSVKPDINISVVDDAEEEAVLCYACENGHFMSVIELLKNKANRDLKTTVGKTALQIATENKHKSIIAAFRKY